MRRVSVQKDWKLDINVFIFGPIWRRQLCGSLQADIWETFQQR